MLSPFDIGMRSPFGPPREWWGYSAGLGDLAYDMCNGRFMQGGTSANQSDVLTEGRTTDAYVLDGFGEYVLRHGPRTNVEARSRRVAGVNIDTTGAVAYTGLSHFGDIGGRVYTAFGITQTNVTITADNELYFFSRLFFPLGVGAKFNTAAIGIAIVDQFACVFDFDTLTTDSGRAPSKVEIFSDGWVRLSWAVQNNGSGTILIWREDTNATSNYASDQTDIIKGSIALGAPIITTGTAVTVPAEPAQADGHGLDGFDEIVNLLTNPEDLSHADWVKGAGATTTRVALDNPAGFPLVTRLERTSSGRPYARQGETVTEDTRYVLTAVVQYINHRYAGLRCFYLQTGSVVYTVFDMIAKTFTAHNGEEVDFGYVALGNNWFEIYTIAEIGADRFNYASITLSDVGGSDLPDVADVPIGAAMNVLWADNIEGGFVPPHTNGTRGADDTRVNQGEGQELVTNGGFATGDFTNWIVTDNGGTPVAPSVTAGVASIPRSAGGVTSTLEQQIADDLIIGSTYTYTFTRGVANIRIRVGSVQGGQNYVLSEGNTPGDNSFSFVATGTAAWLYFLPLQKGTTPTISNIQLKAVTMAPGISANPNELTIRVDWDGVAVGTGTSNYLIEVKNAANKRLSLLLNSAGTLLWGGDQTGPFQIINAGSGFDDGGAHTAISYINQSTSEFKMSVDGETTISGTLTGAVPPNLDEMAISRRASGLASNANGTNCQIYVSEGDRFDEFKDSSAGFF